MNTLLEKILKCVQDRRHPTQKPDILPIASLTEMDRFERIDEEDYSDVVSKTKKVYALYNIYITYIYIFFIIFTYLVLGQLFNIYRRLQFEGSHKSLFQRSY